MTYGDRYFPEMLAQMPKTAAERKASMAAFRAKMLRAHEAEVAKMEASGKRSDGQRANPADIEVQRALIGCIKRAQARNGEV